MPPWRRLGDGLELLCHVQPGAKVSAFAGLYGDAVRLRIAAPAVDGRANAACQAFLANAFAVRQSEVRLLSGLSSRRKRFALDRIGAWPAELQDLGPVAEQ